MELLYAFICDYAKYSGSKIDALGIGFDTIKATTLPARHKDFFLVAKLKGSAEELRNAQADIALKDPKNRDHIKPISRVMPTPDIVSGTEAQGVMIVDFGNMVFDEYGEYTVICSLNRMPLVTIPFKVAEVETPVTSEAT